jgi:N-acetylmuramoyl-L-alanine amidase
LIFDMKKRKNSPIPYILIGVGVIVLLALVVFAITRDPSGVKDKEETEVAEAQMEASGDNGDTDSIAADDQAGSENGDMTMKETEENMQNSENDSLQAAVNGADTSDADGDSASASDAEGSDGAKNFDGSDAAGDSGSEDGNSGNADVVGQNGTSTNGDVTGENGTSETSVADDAADGADVSAPDNESAEASEDAATAASSEEQAAAPAPTPHTGGHLVVIDPGHQSHGMSEKEPNGPGSSNMKAKVTGGTSGKTSGLTEYQLNLTVGLKLRDELVARGYNVIMTRESNDVSLSNVDRAQIANNAGAEAFVRIHANGSDNTSTNGAMTICQTPSNPYNAAYYSQSRKLSDCVLDSFVAATGCKKQYVWETDTMTGINWANVPSTIIEMGYMSNPTEDANMASEAYQSQMVTGIANGIDAFFAN